MSKAGDRYENPVTGEYGYTRIGTEDTGGKLLVSDLRVRPGGAVLGAVSYTHLDVYKRQHLDPAVGDGRRLSDHYRFDVCVARSEDTI